MHIAYRPAANPPTSRPGIASSGQRNGASSLASQIKPSKIRPPSQTRSVCKSKQSSHTLTATQDPASKTTRYPTTTPTPNRAQTPARRGARAKIPKITANTTGGAKK